MKILFAVCAAVAALTVYAPAQAGGNPSAGKEKATSMGCVGCHGPNGNSTTPGFPKLAGQHEGYLLKQLQDYKAGLRNSTQQAKLMTAQAENLSEQDMQDLAAYYTAQDMDKGAAAKELVAEGQKLYRGGVPSEQVSACTGCHGPSGAGNPAAKFPVLSGQHAEYVANQLRAFREASKVGPDNFEAGKVDGRSNDAGRMMQNVAAEMTDSQIEAVASYIQGLR